MKQRLRQEMKEFRNGLDVFAIQTLSDKIFENLSQLDLDVFDKFFIYKSFGSEVDTSKIIKHFIDLGKKVYLPRVHGEVMQSVQIDKGTNFSKNSFGIFEPDGEDQNIDDFVAIMPCLAVDCKGNRLGYGGGYYDKFLANKSATKVAICFDFQVLDEVVSSEKDIKVDCIVTEKRIIHLQKAYDKDK